VSNLTAGLAAFEAADYVNAFNLLKPLANRGDAEAQCIIGNMYDLGLGLEKNILKAVEWYRKSAEQGYGLASNNLGTIFQSGHEDVPIDRVGSNKWYQKARTQGFVHSPSIGLED